LAILQRDSENIPARGFVMSLHLAPGVRVVLASRFSNMFNIVYGRAGICLTRWVWQARSTLPRFGNA